MGVNAKEEMKMDDEYIPPFTMTEEITVLLGEIAQYVGLITAFETLHPNPVLRRENRIRSIHSSLAIEQNTLTLDQVTDVVNGKRIHGNVIKLSKLRLLAVSSLMARSLFRFCRPF